MRRLAAALLLVLLPACTSVEAPHPSTPGATASRPPWPHGAMVAAANPHATDAAIEMLARGGHAVDAAIAAHAVLGLVEPQSSGLGGGGFLLVFERAAGELTFLDGREVAPAGATVDMFVRDGRVMSFVEAWQSGAAVGVPGAVALYASAHERYGALPWPELFAPAIRLATDGFEVSPRLARLIPLAAERGRLDENPFTAAYFFPYGEPLRAGDMLRNPEYAHTLSRIASEGPSAFYTGEIAAAIAAAAREEPDPGALTVEDIAAYEVVERPVVCGEFRRLDVCTTSPPSSGAAQIMITSLYDHLADEAADRDARMAAFVDAQRLAYADRDHYFGDPDEVDVPLGGLLDPAYLRQRARERFAPDAPPTPGDPGLVLRGEPVAGRWAPDTTEEAPGTTHLSIVDGDGNAVSMTATVESAFGSHRWAAGFLLNNEMTDFARDVPADGSRPANAVTPGRRPRSSMSPTIVFDAAEELLMVTGSPGGNSIPAYVAKTLLGILAWGMSAQEAVDYPNVIARGETVRVEISVEPGLSIAKALRARGYEVQEREGENSGLHVVVVRDTGLEGAADKRREGTVRTLPP